MRLRYGRFLVLGGMACLLTTLSACGGRGDDNLADLRAFVQEGAAMKAKIPPLPQPPQNDMVVYTGESEHDPFISFDEAKRRQRAIEIANGPKPDVHRVRQTLEDYDLTSLSLVGVMQDIQKRPWAIIKAPDGKSYRVTLGNYLGKNQGRLASFVERPGETAVRVVELVPSPDGGFEKREQRLEMKDK